VDLDTTVVVYLNMDGGKRIDTQAHRRKPNGYVAE
jgi:hypothetical protein